jgi:hypothetical protein
VSGFLVPHSTPWMREAWRDMDPDTLDRIEAAIPDGLIVGVSVFNGHKGLYRAWVGIDTTPDGYTSIEAAVKAVLRKVEVPV